VVVLVVGGTRCGIGGVGGVGGVGGTRCVTSSTDQIIKILGSL
jgi:hypothetical protein